MSTGYRPPSKEPQGRWARHIHAVRKERGWSQTYGFEQVREGLKLAPKSRTAYIPLDVGPRQPTPDEAEVLASVYGWPAEDSPEPLETTETPETILAAVRLLLDEIRAERAARVEWERGFLEAMQELARGAAPQGDPERELRVGVRR